MTFQPPPSEPGGTPPPPPPGGQWGPPPGGVPGKPAVGPKTINPLDWGIMGAGVLAFLFSFISFYSGADIEQNGRTATFDAGGFSAWHDVIGGGFFGWFAMIFAVLGAVVVGLSLFRPRIELPVAARLGGLALYAAATVFELIAIFVTPGGSSAAFEGQIDVSLNHGFGFWISLVVIVAGLVMSLMRFQQTGGQLPGGLSDKVPNIGGYGPQGGIEGGAGDPQAAPWNASPPSPGYGSTPPPPPQYPGPGSAPPPPPPGYGPPSGH